MLKKMFENQLIDIEGLFLLNYKTLNLTENEAMIVLVLLRLEKINQTFITPNTIAQYMSLDEKTIDKLIVGLMNKNILAIHMNSISTKPLINAILKMNPTKKEIKEQKVNLISMFEKEFGRPLTPIEIETIKEWKQCQYDDEMVLKALKEATLSNVRNLRYIDKILVEWAKYGVKTTGRQTVESSETPVPGGQAEYQMGHRYFLYPYQGRSIVSVHDPGSV